MEWMDFWVGWSKLHIRGVKFSNLDVIRSIRVESWDPEPNLRRTDGDIGLSESFFTHIQLFINPKTLKITKIFQKKANNICWKRSKSLGGRFRQDSQPPPPLPPSPHPTTPGQTNSKDPSVQQSHQQGENWKCLSDISHFSYWNELKLASLEKVLSHFSKLASEFSN